jgi:hypothetical protein
MTGMGMVRVAMAGWGIRTAAVLAVAIPSVVAPVDAQEENVLPDIHITAPPPIDEPPPIENLLSNRGGKHEPASSSEKSGEGRCEASGTGGDHSLGCLNEQLKRKVDQVNPIQNLPPLDARSQDIKVGTVNIPGVQQQYGQNFGHSVFPYRPPSPVYSSGLGRR